MSSLKEPFFIHIALENNKSETYIYPNFFQIIDEKKNKWSRWYKAENKINIDYLYYVRDSSIKIQLKKKAVTNEDVPEVRYRISFSNIVIAE